MIIVYSHKLFSLIGDNKCIYDVKGALCEGIGHSFEYSWP
jgi:hypothetical protein